MTVRAALSRDVTYVCISRGGGERQAPRPASCIACACLFCYDRLFDQVDARRQAYARRLDQLAADGLLEDEALSRAMGEPTFLRSIGLDWWRAPERRELWQKLLQRLIFTEDQADGTPVGVSFTVPDWCKERKGGADMSGVMARWLAEPSTASSELGSAQLRAAFF